MLNPTLRLIFVFIFIIVLGFSIVGHYGSNWDESACIEGLQEFYYLVTRHQPISSSVQEFYGQAFHLVSEVAFQFQQYLRHGPSYRPFFYRGEMNEQFKRLRERVEVDHQLTFAVSLLAYVAVAGVITIFCGFEYAWFGVIVLALFPTFWGHSFFNQKDIPFAAFFSLCIWTGALWLDSFEKWCRSELSFKRLLGLSAGYGVLTGLCTGIRLGGIILPFLVFATHIVLVRKRESSVQLLSGKGISCYALLFSTCFLSALIFYPSFWFRPFALFEGINVLSKYPWPGTVLFQGQQIPGRLVPWNYLPKMFVLTTPVMFQLFLLVGLVLFLRRYPAMTLLQRACLILSLLQIFLLPMVAILGRATLYDSTRHFLFIIPGIAALAGSAMVEFFKSLPFKISRLLVLLAALLFFGITVFDMISLHPYEYIYFNRFSGSLEAAYQKYETEYWGLSLREGMEWINRNHGGLNKVVVAGPVDAAAIYADSALVFDLNYILSFRESVQLPPSRPEKKTDAPSKPFYYLAVARGNFHQYFPECPEVYKVMRQGIPLAVVKRCD